MRRFAFAELFGFRALARCQVQAVRSCQGGPEVETQAPTGPSWQQLIASKDETIARMDRSFAQTIADKDDIIARADAALALANAQAQAAKGTLSRRALYELALSQVRAQMHKAKIQANQHVPKSNHTETERYLVTNIAAIKADTTATPLVQSIADCALTHKLEMGFYASLSNNIHGCGLNVPALQQGDQSLSKEQNDFIACLCTKFNL